MYAFQIGFDLSRKKKTFDASDEQKRTVFSPRDCSSTFISKKVIIEGSPRNEIVLSVSPSISLIEIVRSSEPRASRLSEFHAPQIIAFECLPTITFRLQRATVWKSEQFLMNIISRQITCSSNGCKYKGCLSLWWWPECDQSWTTEGKLTGHADCCPIDVYGEYSNPTEIEQSNSYLWWRAYHRLDPSQSRHISYEAKAYLNNGYLKNIQKVKRNLPRQR